MLHSVYSGNGICIRNHRRAEPPRDPEPPDLLPTVGGRDRESPSSAATDRFQAPARAARGRFRGTHRGRTAPPLPVETGATSGGRSLAGSVPPVLVRSHRCSRTPSRPHGAVKSNEEKDEKENDAAQNRERDKGEMK